MELQQLIFFIVLNICHWAADYTHLSTDDMLAAKRFGNPLGPIARHAQVHASLFFLASMFFVDKYYLAYILLFQFLTHFGIDVLKGKMNVWYPSIASPANRFHWWTFGADQFLHQVVIILTVYFAT